MEVGALGYFGDRPIVDLVGVVDPRVLGARRSGRLAGLFAGAPPDYVVDNPTFRASFLAPLVASGDLDRNYSPVAEFSRPEYPAVVRLLARRFPGRR